MKSYLVLVEAEDYINVEANSDEEAIEKAIREANSGSADWKGHVMSSESFDEDEDV